MLLAALVGHFTGMNTVAVGILTTYGAPIFILGVLSFFDSKHSQKPSLEQLERLSSESHLSIEELEEEANELTDDNVKERLAKQKSSPQESDLDLFTPEELELEDAHVLSSQDINNTTFPVAKTVTGIQD